MGKNNGPSSLGPSDSVWPFPKRRWARLGVRLTEWLPCQNSAFERATCLHLHIWSRLAHHDPQKNRYASRLWGIPAIIRGHLPFFHLHVPKSQQNKNRKCLCWITGMPRYPLAHPFQADNDTQNETKYDADDMLTSHMHPLSEWESLDRMKYEFRC